MPFSSTKLSTEPYTPNGVTTDFPYDFLILTEDEAQVVLTDMNGVETLLTTGFEVQGIGNPDGGVVVFTVAPAFEGQTLTIRTVPSFAQEHDFQNQGPFNPVEINKALDRSAQRSIYLLDLFNSGGVSAPGGGGGVTTVTWASIQGKPTVFTPAAHVHAGEDIASGVVAAARIAPLDATKIVSGAFDPARIPALDASKLTSGVLDPARIPVQSGGVVSSGGIADLTAPQQALIVEGTLVTTSDGAQWRYSGTGSKVLEASYVELSTATDWAAITAKPANVVSLAGLTLAANKGLYSTGASTLALFDLTATGRTIAALSSQNAAIAYTSPLATKGDIYTYGAAPGRLPVGVNGQILTADSAQALGIKWANAPSGTGGSNMPIFTSVFSGNGDGVTNNDAAFVAAEASAFQRIWLPEGTFVTNKGRMELLKRYEGPGRIVYSGGTANQLRTFTTAVPWTFAVDGGYGYNKTSQFSDYEEFRVTGGRIKFDTFNYFDAPSTPKFTRWRTVGADAGFSGTQSHLTATATAGASTVALNSVAGLAPGMEVVISKTEPGAAENFNAGPIANGEKKVIANIVGLNVTFTTPLANTYTFYGTDYVPVYLSGYAQSPQVTRGKRTMNTKDLVIFDHDVAGDGYVWTARVIGNYAPTAGQTDFFDTSTAGMIGGDITLTQSGIYATGWEMSYSDNGVNDVAMIGFVNSYDRTINIGARRVAWGHDFAKSGGAQPIDFVYLFHGKAKVGIDFTFADFSSEGQRAMQLKLDQRIYFDGSASFGAAGIGVKGRGFRGDIAGNIYALAYLIGGVKTWEVQNNGYRIRLFADGSLTTNASFTSGGSIQATNNITTTAGYMHGVGGVAVTTGQRFYLNGPGGNSYLFLNGGTIQLVKNGVVVANW